MPHRDLERHGLGVHGGTDALVEDALEAGFDQGAVVMHAGRSRVEGGWSRGVQLPTANPFEPGPGAVPARGAGPGPVLGTALGVAGHLAMIDREPLRSAG
ncbi:hypothetical protein SHKM778_54680 [Streptomyces sp. KM77-8]|uniref:Uncharacterized protein n=1 Tax=Streptomyces haneummycinicus TaxID=3074435 RepID=A0AAT9HNT6_9ACTN